MILRAALPLQLTQSGFALGNPVGGTQEVFFDSDHVTYGAVLNAFYRLAEPGVKSAVESRDNAQLFLFCEIAGLLHNPDAAGVDAVRFLDEYVFAGLDGTHRMQRMKLGGVGDQYEVRGLDHMFIAIKAREAVFVVHRDLVSTLGFYLSAFVANAVT